MSSKLLIGGVIVVAVGLLVFGRWYGGGTAVQSSNAGIRNQASIGGARGNQLAPDFTLQKLGGGTISLSEFKGKKPVVVDFWASWCPNCRRDMPKMNAMYPKYKDQIEIIGINLHESERTVQNFISSLGISFPIALDPSSQAARVYGIQYTNTHFLIDKEGNLVRQIPGDISESDIIALISSSAEASEDKEENL